MNRAFEITVKPGLIIQRNFQLESEDSDAFQLPSRSRISLGSHMHAGTRTHRLWQRNATSSSSIDATLRVALSLYASARWMQQFLRTPIFTEAIYESRPSDQ